MRTLDIIREQLDQVRQRKLTVPEAAVVFDADPGEIRKAVDRGFLKASFTTGAGRKYRLLGVDHLLAWSMSRPLLPNYRWTVTECLFKPTAWHVDRDQVYLRLFGDEHAGTAPLYVLISEAIPKVTERLKRLDDAASQIEVRRNADAVIKGTEIEAHRIAALLDGGMSVDEVLRDFPSLTREGIATAAAYAKAHPKPGRPYPPRTAKAAIRAGRGGLRRAFAAADG